MESPPRRAELSPFLPIAVRAYTERIPPTQPRAGRPVPAWPQTVLAFDTETSIDETQRLTFGSYRFYRATGESTELSCVQEGLFYAPDLPGEDLATLRAYTASHQAEVAASVNPVLRLHALDEFLEAVLWPAAYQSASWHAPPAVVVGFNLPFDLSRLAYEVGEARGVKAKGRRRVGGFVGGFSFNIYGYHPEDGARVANQYRPGVAVKTIDSKRHLTGFVPPAQIDDPDVFDTGFRGHFLDLRTLAFALTDDGYSLKTACEKFAVEHGKQDAEQHGQITAEYIDYNRADVRATGELYERVIAEYERHPIALQPSKAFSPASIGKAYLKAMGVPPVLRRQPDFPKEVLGYAIGAYYGGRAECRIRRTPVPVAYVDFLSMYPTVNSLMDLWPLVTAEQIDTVEATEPVQTMLDRVDAERCFDPAFWKGIVGLVQIVPDGDVLPVRSRYANSPTASWQIGVNPLTAREAVWYTIPDAIAATLLTGRPPQIKRAIRFEPRGRLNGLKPTELRGTVTVDPGERDFFRAVIEERKTLHRRRELSTTERERLDRFLKVLANSASYGIYAEMVRQELGRQSTDRVTVHGLDRASFIAEVGAPEEPGEYCFPPLAACITGAARLMLALLEHEVTQAGGTYAFCDTDSMAVIATQHGGLTPCPGGPHHSSDGEDAIRALSRQGVETIRARFERLNPYDPDAAPGSILELEDENFEDETRTRPRQLHCLAISAKRYALYILDNRGEPALVKWSEHGLGHLLNPADPEDADRDWIHQLWENLIRREHGLPVEEPAWLDRPALGRITVSKPAVHKVFETYNTGKPYPEQIKPFNFMLTAHTQAFAHPPDTDPEHFQLIAPYEPDPRQWAGLEWTNRDHPGPRYRTTTTGPPTEHAVRIKTYRDVLTDYRNHPEAKSLAPNREQSGWHTEGLLQRRPITATRTHYIGKESNQLEDTEAGLIHDQHERLAEYPHPREDDWQLTVNVLRDIPFATLIEETGIDRTTLWRYRNGHSVPRAQRRDRLTVIAAVHAADILAARGQAAPRDPLDCLSAYGDYGCDGDRLEVAHRPPA